MKKLFLFFIIGFCTSSAFAQTNNFKTLNSSDYALLTNLKLNCNEIDFKDFVKQIKKFKSLKSLSVENYQESYFPEELRHLKIRSLTIKNSPDIDLTSLFGLFEQVESIENLYLENNDVEEIPLNSKFLSKLKTLSITYNENIDIDNFKKVFDFCPNLQTLDLRNNAIDYMPDMSALKVIDSLKLENNLIDNLDFVKSLKDVGLKYLSLDAQESDMFSILETELPTTKIVEKESEVMPVVYFQEEDFEENDIPYERQYGEISINGIKFKALSNAYYHYHKIFNNRRFIYDFDTLMFNQRYLDTTYVVTWKIQDNASYYMVGIHKDFCFWSKHIKFSIYPKHPGYFYRTFPELRAYHNMSWVYKGDLSKKEFKQKYIKNKEWLDMRVYYHEEAKDFTVQLKYRSGFEDIEAYPIVYSKNRELPLEVAQKQYLRNHIRYSKSLDTRKKRFHSGLIRDKKKYERTRNRSIKKTWESFQKVYMCEEERKMTKEEWLLYYDEVIKNEIRALASSTTTINLLERSLDLEKYQTSNIEDLVENDAELTSVGFVNKDNETLPVKQFLVIDLSSRSYNKYGSDLGISLQSVFLSKQNTCIVAELRNGDIGFINSSRLFLLEPDELGELYIPLQIIEKELSTIGQVYKTLRL